VFPPALRGGGGGGGSTRSSRILLSGGRACASRACVGEGWVCLARFFSLEGSVRDEAANMSKLGVQLLSLNNPLKDDIAGILSPGYKVLKTGEALKEVCSCLSLRIIPSRSCQIISSGTLFGFDCQ
jgi:hypothetical protein